MLQAFLVIVGLCAWAVIVRGGTAASDGTAILTCVVLAGLVAWRLGWLGREAAVLPRFIKHIALTPARMRAKTAGALSVARAAISADVTMRPGLIKVAIPSADPVARAQAASAIGQGPGALCVALVPDAVLAHVIDEERQTAEALVARAGLPPRRAP
jgi:multisubunit Na+/H+ antiporter MnhE subunit